MPHSAHRTEDGLEVEKRIPAQRPENGAGQVEGAFKRALIEEALTRLDREQREVLVALHYCRFPVSEVAVQLNIPTRTVNARALSALKAIRSFLNQSPQP
ncbi:RNA polymerase sigma factor [Arthrobacter sp. ISL-65]|uniref:RNA polymerase sigma factor n=1 Tax=Arthrobacter sp. ISL-65 TaxID=2819112 RepID=UPI001BE58B34|nr:sigma factor-like helix-turn-helix DNA-binding protein [Arthrobacter sp. ISL-65]MBT2550419.1 sigma-70 family RNA polymerase sigma factor [Arthrobacter sp. ISL-65]